MSSRSDARRMALQMLFLVDQNPDADVHWIREEIAEQLKQSEVSDFAWRLFTGVREQQVALDEQIVAVAQNWRLDRMAATDRTVLRMGCYEMQVVGTPRAVVLNEAIELAREFGAENSSAFVNGILDRISSASESAESSVPG